MFSAQLRRQHLYLFGAALLALMLAVSYLLVLKPKFASAGGEPTEPSCSISHISTYGSAATFRINTSNADAGLLQIPYGGRYQLVYPIPNGYHTYYFLVGGDFTIRGKVIAAPLEGGLGGVERFCSRRYTQPDPNQQAIAWVDNISCIAGALTFNASVSDGNGGTPGYYLSIQNVGDTGWIYRPNGTYGHGPWGVVQDGGTYSISIWAADAQTGGVVGPGVYYYSCPAPPPPTPPTCTLSVNPTLVPPNSSSTLSWTSANATSFSVDQGVGALSPVAAGSRLVNPGQTSKTYTGTVSGAGGSANCSTTLTVGSIGCSLNSISTIEPGDSYQPQVNVSYTAGGSGNAVVTATVTITNNGTPVTRTSTPTTLAPGANQNIDLPPPITFNAASNWPVTSKTVSGTINGIAFGPTACGGATTVPVVQKPYFKVFNGGVTVGAGFNSGTTTCSSVTTGQVSGFASNSPSLHGASTQYDLKALRSVATTFYSSGGRQPATPNFKALTFANNAASGTYGGSFGGTSCITDYYTTTKKTGIGSYPGNGNINIAMSDAQAGASDQVESLVSRTFTGGNLAAGSRLTIYVTGDVYITGNVTLATNYTTVADIPFFALVVKGNIMIAPGVTTLDGLYIAQPNGATGGTVYTCATSGTTIPAAAALHGTCGTKLTFNGSVVAKSIKLLRTIGTLRSGPANETSASANISEVFNGMPELFIANPAFKIDETSTELYDSITSLPPLL